jgi:predicted secreted protein
MKRFALAAVFALTAMSCEMPAAHSKVVQVNETQNDTAVTLAPGDVLEITLPGNITTGFSWNITGVAGQALKPSGKVEYNAKPTGLVGAPGLFTAKLTAANVGKSIVRMAYRRPWEEKKKKAARMFVLTVSVKK